MVRLFSNSNVFLLRLSQIVLEGWLVAIWIIRMHQACALRGLH